MTVGMTQSSVWTSFDWSVNEVGVQRDENTCLSSCVECGVEVGVCGADRNEGEVVGGRSTLVDVNESLDAADGLCLHKALKMKDSKIASNGEDGVTVCGWSSSKNAAGTHISIETSKIFANEYHGVLVSGGERGSAGGERGSAPRS